MINLIDNKNNKVKSVSTGFSWPTLLFGAWVPLFRTDWMNFLIMLFSEIILDGILLGNGLTNPPSTGSAEQAGWAIGTIIGGSGVIWFGSSIIHIIFAFTYNKMNLKALLKKGFFPDDEFSKKTILSKGIKLIEK